MGAGRPVIGDFFGQSCFEPADGEILGTGQVSGGLVGKRRHQPVVFGESETVGESEHGGDVDPDPAFDRAEMVCQRRPLIRLRCRGSILIRKLLPMRT